MYVCIYIYIYIKAWVLPYGQFSNEESMEFESSEFLNKGGGLS